MKTPDSENPIFYIYEYSRFLFTYRKSGRGTVIDDVVMGNSSINSAPATTKIF